ncbi:hypothetical protein ColLi_09262 [Colletotrichum liriopes]|uniref:Uncharacterized protein n=1 Tax=Colletotrichum liriopes TaxID=708192 RepID=A0AA37LVL9_9PEZI|nr:hypothetical protein ColLi_09262 [Colletotrichum liriopes]
MPTDDIPSEETTGVAWWERSIFIYVAAAAVTVAAPPQTTRPLPPKQRSTSKPQRPPCRQPPGCSPRTALPDPCRQGQAVEEACGMPFSRMSMPGSDDS